MVVLDNGDDDVTVAQVTDIFAWRNQHAGIVGELQEHEEFTDRQRSELRSRLCESRHHRDQRRKLCIDWLFAPFCV